MRAPRRGLVIPARNAFALLLVLAVSAAAAFAALAISGDAAGVPDHIVRREHPHIPRPLSLHEVWNVAAVAEWDGNWEFLAVFSTDVNDDPDAMSGHDGRRRTWQIEVRGTGGSIRWLRVTDGVLVEAIEAAITLDASGKRTSATAAGPPALPGPPVVESEAALQAARGYRLLLEGGRGKADGYHFHTGGRIVRSHDGGETWTETPSPGVAPLILRHRTSTGGSSLSAPPLRD